jgi:hypothetical protein
MAGGAAALWLHISLEGLPFAAALAGLFGLRWLLDHREAERLAAFTGALAAGSAGLFLLTKAPSQWLLPYCDAIAPAHLLLFAIAALGCIAIVRSGVTGLVPRLSMCAAVAAAGLGAVTVFAPHCAAGPFEALDPLVERFWYQRVLEGLPVWRQTFTVMAVVLAFPLVGLLGTWRRYRIDFLRRREWGALLFLLASATLAAVFVQRAGAVANLLALPGGVWLFHAALVRARGLSPLRRIAGLAGAMLIVTPAYAVGGAALALGDFTDERKMDVALDCANREEISKLSRLPAGGIAAPLDISPAIILFTKHKVIASGHHRNGKAMTDVIELFTRPPEEARGILAARNIEYIAVCPRLVEPQLFTVYGKRGLWAELEAGRAPPWLKPVRLDRTTPLQVWQVVPLR